MPVPTRSPLLPGLIAVIPALNEEGSIADVVRGLYRMGVARVIVGDNDSRDRTAAEARAAGATVVLQRRRGYGSACLAALAHLPPETRAVLFCDADGADDLRQVPVLAKPVLAGRADLVIGSRATGHAAPGALTKPQRVGNAVAALLMRVLYRVTVTDLGPFRCIGIDALRGLAMRDPDFGWTAEMQVKAYRQRLRVLEVPVNAHCRTAGESKVSGRVIPVFRAGWAIVATILRYHTLPLPVRRRHPAARPADLLAATTLGVPA